MRAPNRTVENLFVRICLHLRAHPGDLHAQKSKHQATYQRACDADQPIAGKKLQYLLPGGKATANNDRHICKGNLDGLFIHDTFSFLDLLGARPQEKPPTPSSVRKRIDRAGSRISQIGGAAQVNRCRAQYRKCLVVLFTIYTAISGEKCGLTDFGLIKVWILCLLTRKSIEIY
jgi:hypothetical protein